SAAYLEPGSSDEPPAFVGSPELTAEWCRVFTQRVLGSATGTTRELVRSEFPPMSGVSPLPDSAAMVCLSQSRQVWLVALSFAGGRAFEPADVRLLSFLRRMYLAARHQEKARSDLKGSLFGVVQGLTTAADTRVPHAAGHSERVAKVAVRLGRELRLPG